MSNHLVPVNGSYTLSLFDNIKNTNPETGTEEWSAREIMPLMGYPRWNEFQVPIIRAMKAAENQGYNVQNLFRVSAEKTGGRPREDFHLTRFAAYLIAMNGDPNKPEVAAAQAYFAIKTREAETAQTFNPASLTRRDILTMAIEAEERAELAEAENAAFKGGDGIRIKDFIKTYFTTPGERQFFEWLYLHGYLIDGRIYEKDGRSARSGSGPKMRWDHMHPSYRGRAYFKLVAYPSSPHGARRCRVIPERALDLVALFVSAPDIGVQMTEEGRAALDNLNDINPNQYRLIAGD